MGKNIMIGHYLAKLYGSILKSELSIWAERNPCRSSGQAGFWKGFTTLDRILIHRALTEEGRAHNKRIYCCFVDFRKAFDIVPCAWFMQRREALGVPADMQWRIFALYENPCQEKCGLPRVCQRQWLAQSEWNKDSHYRPLFSVSI